MVKKVLISLAALVVIGGVVWFIDRYFFPPSIRQTTDSNLGEISDLVSDEKKKEDTTDKIVYLSEDDQAKKVVLADLAGKDKKTLFSDAEEEAKIKKIGSLAYLTNEVLILAGKSDSVENQLEVIKTDGSGQKEVIVEAFGTPESLAISPDGKTVAYVSFSNVEKDYGFSLYTMARDGTNKRLINRGDREMRSLSWNKEGDKIAFWTTTSEEKTEIQIVEVESTKNKSIYSSEQNMTSLSWNEEGKIIFGQYERDKNTSVIKAINEDGSGQVKILETTEGVANFIYLSSDNLNVTFLLTQLKDGKIEENTNGEIETAKSSGENLKKIADGFSIAGWLP